jgi:hypothetical protein
MFFSLLKVVLYVVTLRFISGEVSTMIPLATNGYGFHRGNSAAITTVEFFIDLTCSSCLESWPLLTQVYQSYKDRVRFLYRIFPLPYHQQGFIVAKAAQVVDQLGSKDSVFAFFDIAFDKQPLIYNSATYDTTYNQVLAIVEPWVTLAANISSSDYYNAMNSSTTIGKTCEMNARYMWKYVTLQGVFATPFFAINGLQVGGLETLADWQSALDPLVA